MSDQSSRYAAMFEDLTGETVIVERQRHGVSHQVLDERDDWRETSEETTAPEDDAIDDQEVEY